MDWLTQMSCPMTSLSCSTNQMSCSTTICWMTTDSTNLMPSARNRQDGIHRRILGQLAPVHTHTLLDNQMPAAN